VERFRQRNDVVSFTFWGYEANSTVLNRTRAMNRSRQTRKERTAVVEA